MIPISTLTLAVSDGSTITSTELYGTDKKTYINIGSGNVFKLSWADPEPVLTDDKIDHYSLVIKRHDTTLNTYYDIFNKNIGLVTEFYVDSFLLPPLPLQYKLSIYVVAYGKNGGAYTSNIVTPYVSRGNGTYTKVECEGYAQAIMKRAVAFVKAPAEEDFTAVILDQAGNKVALFDSHDEAVQVAATKILTGAEWEIAQEGYTKDTENNWRKNDLMWEVLVDEKGVIITDENDEPIYVL